MFSEAEPVFSAKKLFFFPSPPQRASVKHGRATAIRLINNDRRRLASPMETLSGARVTRLDAGAHV